MRTLVLSYLYTLPAHSQYVLYWYGYQTLALDRVDSHNTVFLGYYQPLVSNPVVAQQDVHLMWGVPP